MYPPSNIKNPDVVRFPVADGMMPTLGRCIVTF